MCSRNMWRMVIKNSWNFYFHLLPFKVSVFFMSHLEIVAMFVNVQSAVSQPKKYLISNHKLVFWFLSLWQDKNWFTQYFQHFSLQIYLVS